MFRANQPPKQHSVAKSSRLGFTLIELIVVILVISILMAILMPSIGGVFTSAREAQVVADIKNIEAAIAAFKLKYGIDPPSSFLLGNSSASYTTPLGRNSLNLMRQIWPHYAPLDSPDPMNQYQYGYPLYELRHLRGGEIPGLPTNPNSSVTLNGAECLAFFLCGPNVLGSNKDLAPNGFSANPQNPFIATGSRVGPFLELDGARLKKIDDSVTTTEICRKIFDTLPNQTRPYQYFSSYDGRGYQPFGYDGIKDTDDDEVLQLSSGEPPMKSVYLKKDAEWNNPGNPPRAGNNVGNNWNTKTYQIISPGLDGEYGIGGEYSSQDGIIIKDGDSDRSLEVRRPELDNITNFSGGSIKKYKRR